MLDKISKSFVCKLKNAKIITTEESEVYEYGIKILLQDTITSVCIIYTGLVMKCLPECITLYLTFASVRRYSGGIHAGKYIVCFIASNLLMSVMMLGIKYSDRLPFFIFPTMLIAGLVFIVICSPVENQNKPLSEYERIRYRRISIILTIALSLIAILLGITEKYSSIGVSIIMGIFLTGVMTAAARIKQRKITKMAEKSIKTAK